MGGKRDGERESERESESEGEGKVEAKGRGGEKEERRGEFRFLVSCSIITRPDHRRRFPGCSGPFGEGTCIIAQHGFRISGRGEAEELRVRARVPAFVDAQDGKDAVGTVLRKTICEIDDLPVQPRKRRRGGFISQSLACILAPAGRLAAAVQPHQELTQA